MYLIPGWPESVNAGWPESVDAPGKDGSVPLHFPCTTIAPLDGTEYLVLYCLVSAASVKAMDNIRDIASNALGTERQQAQAEKMQRMFRESTAGVRVGCIVSLRVDPRDQGHGNSRGVVGIVTEKTEAGSIGVVTEQGMLVNGRGRKGRRLFPDQAYQLRDDLATVSEALTTIRSTVLDGTFNAKNHKTVTIQKAHQSLEGLQGQVVMDRCRCKAGCRINCGCQRARKSCGTSCRCSGTCQNTFNTC
jgi:hypothetical protein